MACRLPCSLAAPMPRGDAPNPNYLARGERRHHGSIVHELHQLGACSGSPPPSASLPFHGVPTFAIRRPLTRPRRSEVTRGLVFLVALATWLPILWNNGLSFCPSIRKSKIEKYSGKGAVGSKPAGGTSSHRPPSRFHTQQIPDRAGRRLYHYQHRGSPALDRLMPLPSHTIDHARWFRGAHVFVSQVGHAPTHA